MAYGRSYSVEVQVSRIWKGSGERTKYINSYGDTCEAEFKVGYEYLIYAFREEGFLTTGMCTVFGAEDATHLDALGPGVALVPEPEGERQGIWVFGLMGGLIGAAAGFALAGLGFVAIRRRARQT